MDQRYISWHGLHRCVLVLALTVMQLAELGLVPHTVQVETQSGLSAEAATLLEDATKVKESVTPNLLRWGGVGIQACKSITCEHLCSVATYVH